MSEMLDIETAYSNYVRAVCGTDDVQGNMRQLERELQVLKDQAPPELRMLARRCSMDLGQCYEDEMAAGVALRETIVREKTAFVGSDLLNTTAPLGAPTEIWTS